MSNKPMTIVLIEDNADECDAFRKVVNSREDVKLIGVTDSDIEGLQYVKNNMPEGIILDLELHKGKGNGTGLDFLTALKDMKLQIKPKIVITTNVFSDPVYDYAHENGADLIFYKKQINYSQEKVINTLLILRGYKTYTANENLKTEIVEERRNIISSKIDDELDLIGISSHLQGRKYLHDAILFLLENTDNTENQVTVIQHLVNLYKRSNSTITRAMQNAILHAWRISSLEDLTTYYTARINYETGIPTPTEFIYYYKDKIKKIISNQFV